MNIIFVPDYEVRIPVAVEIWIKDDTAGPEADCGPAVSMREQAKLFRLVGHKVGVGTLVPGAILVDKVPGFNLQGRERPAPYNYVAGDLLYFRVRPGSSVRGAASPGGLDISAGGQADAEDWREKNGQVIHCETGAGFRIMYWRYVKFRRFVAGGRPRTHSASDRLSERTRARQAFQAKRSLRHTSTTGEAEERSASAYC